MVTAYIHYTIKLEVQNEGNCVIPFSFVSWYFFKKHFPTRTIWLPKSLILSLYSPVLRIIIWWPINHYPYVLMDFKNILYVSIHCSNYSLLIFKSPHHWLVWAAQMSSWVLLTWPQLSFASLPAFWIQQRYFKVILHIFSIRPEIGYLHKESQFLLEDMVIMDHNLGIKSTLSYWVDHCF